ncbi:hypothetical protein CYLTODRAFT_487646 [Cylindrobasidium torrendii FP15055 ss-10]|uniref:BRCT domain-containing protein n=1 Tax=Cylindrobasidium torrendii FP15055 ss-10 TaxID=1314674 RepID=A0A0D7BN54_9AGAR|nr:hypothetical protein CYLTODRAFT_487646 [Cylindrobasidium torrendii FP15055 ss-10]
MHFRSHKGEALRIHVASYLVQRKKMALFIGEHSGETVDDEGAADILLIDKNCDAGRETVAKWGAPNGRTIVLHYPWFIECRQMDKLMLEEDDFHGYRVTSATERRARPSSPTRRHKSPLPTPPPSGRSRHPTESTPSSPSSASQTGRPPATNPSAPSIPTALPLSTPQTMTAEQLQQVQLQMAGMPMFNPMFANMQVPSQMPMMQTNPFAMPYAMSNPYQFQQFCMAMASQMPQMANFSMGFPMPFAPATAMPQTFPFFQQQTHTVPPQTTPASAPAVPSSSAKANKRSQKSHREDKDTDTRKAKRTKPTPELQAPVGPQPGPSRGRSPSPVRAVKKLFTANGNALLFLIESDVWHRSDLASSVRGQGGKITNDVLEADYIVLPDRFDAKIREPLLDEAETHSIPLVKRSFIIACLNDENLVDPSHHKPISEKVLGKQRRISVSSLSDLTSMRSDEDDEEESVVPTRTRRQNIAKQAARPTPQKPAWARDLRTPPPPSDIIPGRYTEDEKEFAYETVRVRMTLDPTISKTSISKELAKRDPNHTYRAWQQMMWLGPQCKATMQQVMADAKIDHLKRTGKDTDERRPAKRPRVSQTAGEELVSDHACERDYEAIVQLFVDFGESIGDGDLESQWERIYEKMDRRCETEEDWSVFYDKHDEEILRRFEIRKQQHP